MKIQIIGCAVMECELAGMGEPNYGYDRLRISPNRGELLFEYTHKAQIIKTQSIGFDDMFDVLPRIAAVLEKLDKNPLDYYIKEIEAGELDSLSRVVSAMKHEDHKRRG